MSKMNDSEKQKFWRKAAAQNTWRAFSPEDSADSSFRYYDALWRPERHSYFSGKGRTLAIIDQPLWRHSGYKNNLVDVQTVQGAVFDSSLEKSSISYHGAAVVSIAVGEIGVARNANVVYRAFAPWAPGEERLHNHFRALKDLRAWVGAGNPIDAISTSHGWTDNAPWAKETKRIINWFEARNIPVFSVNSISPFIIPCGPFGFAECVRNNPSFSSLTADNKVSFSKLGKKVAIPIDQRGLACWAPGQIKFLSSSYYREAKGGWSWAVPFVAGLFVGARQVLPELKKEEFVKILLGTRQTFKYVGGATLPTVDVNQFMETLQYPASRWKERLTALNQRRKAGFML